MKLQSQRQLLIKMIHWMYRPFKQVFFGKLNNEFYIYEKKKAYSVSGHKATLSRARIADQNQF